MRHSPRHPNTINVFPYTAETLQKYLFSKNQTFRALVVMFHNALLKSIGSAKRKIFNINTYLE